MDELYSEVGTGPSETAAWCQPERLMSLLPMCQEA